MIAKAVERREGLVKTGTRWKENNKGHLLDQAAERVTKPQQCVHCVTGVETDKFH